MTSPTPEERQMRIEEITSDLRAAQKDILGLGDMPPELAPLVGILRSILRNTDFLLDELSRHEQEHQGTVRELQYDVQLQKDLASRQRHAHAEEIRKAKGEGYRKCVLNAQMLYDVYAQDGGIVRTLLSMLPYAFDNAPSPPVQEAA